MTKSEIRSICMLSTHGYVDSEPQLGRTDTGGQVVYVLQLSKALTELGMKVDIYTRWFDESKERVEKIPGHPNLRIIRIRAGPWSFIPKEELYNYLPELANNMIEFIRNNELDYDIFHAHYVDAGIVALHVAKVLNKPVFFTSHSLGAWKRELMKGPIEEMEKKYKFERRIAEEQRIFCGVNGQIATSIAQTRIMETLYKFKSANIIVLPPGVDINTFRPDHCEALPNMPEKYIFCLSRIDENKGHELLLKAFDLVRKSEPDTHLIIGGGSLKPKDREIEILDKIKKIVDEKEMNQNVHVVGYVPDEQLLSFYQCARMFVLPSTFEPFGMTALEAMACGIPVIVSSFAGVVEFLLDRVNCLVANPKSSEEFAEAILTLLRNKKMFDKISREVLRAVHERFSWRVIADKHIQFYKEFMN